MFANPGSAIRNLRQRTVLFVTNAYSYGGSEKHLLELLQRMEDPGVRCVILSTDSDPFTERLDARLSTQVTIRIEKSLTTVSGWARVFREIKPDVVVLIYGTLWMLPWTAAAGAKLAGVHKIYSIQHLMPQPPSDPLIDRIRSPRDILRKLFGKRVRKLLAARVPPRLANCTICVSDAVRNALIRDYGFPADKTTTVRNGVSTRDFQPGGADRESTRAKLAIRPDEFLLVCTARLSPEKGIDILLSALGRVVARHPGCKCVVIGEGALHEQLIAQAASLGISQNVCFVGFQPDVRPFLHAADAFVMTSHIEGLPYSVLEAMSCGLPCIVTNVGGNAEAVLQGSNGFVIPSGSVEAAADAITKLLTQPGECRQMATASRARAVKDFDTEARMADIRSLILS